MAGLLIWEGSVDGKGISRPPLHALVALNDCFDFLSCQLFVGVSVTVVRVAENLERQSDLLESNGLLELRAIKAEIGLTQKLLLHKGTQRTRTTIETSFFL